MISRTPRFHHIGLMENLLHLMAESDSITDTGIKIFIIAKTAKSENIIMYNIEKILFFILFDGVTQILRYM